MARPKKQGLGYFPLDTDLLGNRKIQRLLHEYGSEGIVVYLTLLCEIYAANGYFINYNEDLCFDVGFTLKLKESRVAEIILFCIKVRLFCKELFEQNQILSSAGIQQRYLEVNKRYRKSIDPDMVLVTETDFSVTETSIKETKTLPKGKGKGKINKEKNEIIKKDEKDDQSTGSDEGSVRQAELLRMAEAATKNC